MSLQPSAWYRLRASRAQPPGLAADDKARASTYRAALQQAEELMRAAGAVGPASRPLPLYYAISQAGRAVVAARGTDGQLDAPEHGLKFPTPAGAVLESLVAPTKKGQFPAIAAATESPALATGVQLGALMATLPELARLPELASQWHRPLPVWPLRLENRMDQVAYQGLVPGLVVFDSTPVSADELAAALKPYPMQPRPHIRNQAVLPPGLVIGFDTPDGYGVELLWTDPDDGTDPLPRRYGPEGRRWLRPAVCGTDFPPSLLMTWWAVLYGLSMLARYHPVEWVRALDLDSSPVSVVLEATLDVALEVVPELVLEAIEVADAQSPCA